MYDSSIVVRHSLRLIRGELFYVLHFRSGQRYTLPRAFSGHRDRLLRRSNQTQMYAPVYRDVNDAALAMS